ncbi:MAG: hypothetical protein PUB17_02210 [Lachnospiraceae bacterium]|nr:hypothetical protein [Lachnospiraceae bacterium]
MKTIMKRIAALVLIAAMAVMAVAGCSKSSGSKSAGNKSADTMFGLMKEAQSLEKKTFEASAEINANGTKAAVTLNGKSDGKATSVGAAVTYGGVSVTLDDVIVFTDDVLYINAGSILEQLKPFIDAAGEEAASVTEALGDLGWVSFEAKGLFATASYDEVYDILDKAFDSVIKKDGSKFTISLSSKDDIQAVVDATAKMLKENKDTFVKIITDAYDKADVKDIIENMVNELVDKLAAASGNDVSDEDKQTLKDQLMSSIDTSDVEVSKEDIESSIDDAVKELEDTEIADEDVDGKANVNVYKEDGAYITEMEMDVTEDGEASSATIKSTIKEDSSVKVDVPTDAASLVDIVVNIYASYLESMTD